MKRKGSAFFFLVVAMLALGFQVNAEDNELLQSARQFYSSQDYSKAIELYTRYLKQDKQNALAYFERGMAYLNSNHPKEALTDYSQAIKLNPENPEFYTFRAQVYLKAENYLQAVPDLDTAIKLSPNKYNLFSLRAYTQAILKKYDEALKDYDRALILANSAESTELGEIYVARGMVKEKLNLLREALEDYSEGLKKIKGDDLFNMSAAHYGRSRVLDKLGDPEAASTDRKKAEEWQAKWNKQWKQMA